MTQLLLTDDRRGRWVSLTSVLRFVKIDGQIYELMDHVIVAIEPKSYIQIRIEILPPDMSFIRVE